MVSIKDTVKGIASMRNIETAALRGIMTTTGAATNTGMMRSGIRGKGRNP
ncbi:MAG: hypothetical protein ACM3MB_03745 [Acidobacteriota bacterium]